MTDFVKPALSEWTMWHAIPAIWARITPVGVVKKDSDNSTPTSKDEMAFFRETVRENAEHFTNEIRLFLVNNNTLLPELNITTGIGRQTPRPNNYSTGIHLNRTNYFGDNLPIDWGNNPDNWPENRI